EFSKILIVPGSAFYVKPMERGTDPRAKLKFDPDTGKRELEKDKTPDHRRQHVLAQVDSALAAVAGTSLASRASRWAVIQAKSGGGSDFKFWNPSDANPIFALLPPLQLIRSNVETGTPRIARNATWALLGGRRFAKYDKHGDFFETEGKPDEMVFVPGTKNQCPVIGGYKFGFEICYDHANASLKHRGVLDIAFHLVVSDMVKTTPNNMAMMKGGYFLHASTCADQTCVYRRDDKGVLQNLTKDVRYRLAHDGQAGEFLDFYKLPLPE
ncbi:MAG TPA: hypothetical protein VF832_15830, partial [Longimicrobiales bacterium]